MENDIAHARGGKRSCGDECKRSGKGSRTGGFCIQRGGYDKGRNQEDRGGVCQDGNSCGIK